MRGYFSVQGGMRWMLAFMIAIIASALCACGRKEEVASGPAAAAADPMPAVVSEGRQEIAWPLDGYRVTEAKEDFDGTEVD